MALKLSPENWIAGLVKSATNGRIISVRLRRILTLIIIPIWITGLVISIQGFFDARKATAYYNEQKARLDYLNSTYRNDNGRYDNSRNDYQSGMNWAEGKMNGYYYGLYFILLCFIIPWLITRIAFWIIDAKEVEQEQFSEPK
jgi:hypothetical protein